MPTINQLVRHGRRDMEAKRRRPRCRCELWVCSLAVSATPSPWNRWPA